MTRTEMLATYFVNDTGDTGTWRLKGWGQSILGMDGIVGRSASQSGDIGLMALAISRQSLNT